MNISLTPELETMVQAQIASGKYGDESEVIRDALMRMLQNQDDGYEAWLEAEIAKGVEQADRGEVEPFCMQKIRDEARAERQSRQKQ